MDATPCESHDRKRDPLCLNDHHSAGEKFQDEYMLNRIVIQDEVLNFIESIPVCTGLGVRTDVADLELFYSLFSGREISCAGFLDLSTLSVLS